MNCEKTNPLLEKIQQFRPIDDVFFEKLIEDINVCEEILRVILEDDKLEVVSVVPQRSIKNLWGRSVRLDAFCILRDGRICNIEVQKANDDDHVRRVRYNASCVTANNTDVGEKFVKVPDVTIVYISDFDMFKGGKTIYRGNNTLLETGEIINNGLSEIYVNTLNKDGTVTSELMECFLQKDVENKKFPFLSQRVKFLKESKEGRKYMCEIMEEYAKEYAKECDVIKVRKLFGTGGSLEMGALVFESLSRETLEEIYNEVNGVETSQV